MTEIFSEISKEGKNSPSSTRRYRGKSKSPTIASLRADMREMKTQLYATSINSRDDFLGKLEYICNHSIEKGAMGHAIQAAKIIGKTKGYLEPTKPKTWVLQEMSDEDLTDMIEQIQSQTS